MRGRTKLLVGGMVALGALAVAGPAFAQDAPPTVEEQLTTVTNDLNTVFVFLSGVLVFFMGMGFALVETGLTRSRSAAHMMMKNLITAAIGVAAFWAVGMAFAYGDGSDFIGWSGFFLTGTYESGYSALSAYASVDVYAMWFFQAAFAATSATILSGAMAERTKLKSYLVVAVIISAVIYPIIAKWQWGGGWLSQLGFKDYAGSTIVHLTGGVAALVGAYLLGPRIGRYGADGKIRPIPGHSIPFAVLGTFVLWVGWFGFNVGSMLGTSGIGMSIAVTALGGAFGAISAMLVTLIRDGASDVSMTANGALAGLVGITAGAGFIEPWASAVIGAAAGVIVVFAVALVDKLRIDDPVGAVSVHGVCGAFGTICVGLFDKDSGLLTGGGAEQLLDQIIGVVAVIAFVGIVSFVLFSVVKATMGLRVPAEEELDGLDKAEHGSLGYGEDVYVHESGEPVRHSTRL
jgi:Amt family ammonium transporter